ncbi:xaa-Pro dipeptidase [Plectosphaerella plurivora]|uniref:Xaa-Pro aminopeptidase n=1 Tax=Plectosphaerella plurivora TaxID=936078 RepID=A0A9P8VC37_9PEZI|nr:xaa-Pro dipeptidase [Plectosphaerella plurivora]
MANVKVAWDPTVVDAFDALSIEVRVSEADNACTACTRPEQKNPSSTQKKRSSSPSSASSSPKSKYPAKTHARKVAKELNTSNGLVLLPGEPSRTYEHSDMSPPFRQRRYFYYLTGVDQPDCYVTYDLVADHLTLWVPFIEARQILWYGRTPSPEDYLANSDLDSVRYTRDLTPFLHAYFNQHSPSTVFLLDKAQVPPSLETTFAQRYEFDIDTAALQPAMDEARVVKTDHEIALIRRANDISSAAHRAVQRRLSSFTNEREVQALFEAECALRGAKRQAYAVIAGSGPNAATLHYDDNDQPLKGRQFLVLDAGCEVSCYASDVTRTLPIRGTFTAEARAIYRLVASMQTACIEAVKPGILYYALHVQASSIAQAGLFKLGILRGNPAAAWAAGTVAGFFPHGLGHHVGLETHDVTGNTRLLLSSAEAATIRASAGARITKRDMFSAEAFRRIPYAVASAGLVAITAFVAADIDRPTPTSPSRAATTTAPPPPYRGRQTLKPGMVVTIEPGVYFCREYLEGYFRKSEKHRDFIDWDRLEDYYHVGGVRIEDDILVTKEGYENLTTAPKGSEMVAVINGEDGDRVV